MRLKGSILTIVEPEVDQRSGDNGDESDDEEKDLVGVELGVLDVAEAESEERSQYRGNSVGAIPESHTPAEERAE